MRETLLQRVARTDVYRHVARVWRLTLLLGELVLRLKGETMSEDLVRKLARLLGYFVLSVCVFVIVSHLTNLVRGQSPECFVIFTAVRGLYTSLFWIGQIVLGTLVPAVLLLGRRFNSIGPILLSAALVVMGGLVQLYVLIIGSGRRFR